MAVVDFQFDPSIARLELVHELMTVDKSELQGVSLAHYVEDVLEIDEVDDPVPLLLIEELDSVDVDDHEDLVVLELLPERTLLNLLAF